MNNKDRADTTPIMVFTVRLLQAPMVRRHLMAVMPRHRQHTGGMADTAAPKPKADTQATTDQGIITTELVEATTITTEDEDEGGERLRCRTFALSVVWFGLPIYLCMYHQVERNPERSLGTSTDCLL